MIRVLEKNVADKIAAGEVIDRPVSIVKELVENSLDAGASSIVVEIRGGGKDYIRVTDDGCGMDEEDAKLAFRRHATSKIVTEKDLDAIETLGFRGEALASICAVSRVELITRRGEDRTGINITVEGSDLLDVKATGCPAGTTITVKDLFFNVPARLKFLSSDSSEGRRIVDMMSRIAMSYPDVRFRVINGKKEAFTTSGKGNILENILRIYGTDLKEGLLPVDHFSNGCLLRGFVSEPSLSSSSRNRQFFCINGRVVSSKTIERGLEKAYRQRLFTGRFPLAFLFLSVPAEILDVNVHPTKKEVRFDDPYMVEDMVEKAVSKALQGEGSVPTAPPRARPVLSETEESDAVDIEKVASDTETTGAETEEVDIKILLEGIREEVREEQLSFKAEDDVINIEKTKVLDIGRLELVGIVLDTYIITTLDENVYIIDQHAAHERILFENFLKSYKQSAVPTQTLLTPLQISISADLAADEASWIDHVRMMGYHIEPFGDRVYIVREMPAFVSGEEGERFLRQFFIQLEDKPDMDESAALEGIIMRSCKSAVKGGDRLHTSEVISLLDQLKECDNPYSCPHGRPVLVKLTRYDLEKMFKRA